MRQYSEMIECSTWNNGCLQVKSTKTLSLISGKKLNVPRNNAMSAGEINENSKSVIRNKLNVPRGTMACRQVKSTKL